MELMKVFLVCGLNAAFVMAMSVAIPTAAVAFLKRSYWAGKKLDGTAEPIFVVASLLALLAAGVTFFYSLVR